MSDGIYQVVQFGRQTVVGTPVAATTVFPVDAGFLGFELDRASESPDEDYGSGSREQPGRESHGVRYATASLPFVGRFNDLMHALEMHVKGSVSPTGIGPYTYVYTFDDTSDTRKPYTVEYGVDGSTQDEFRATGVIAPTLELGFDALSAPGNAMWRGTVGLVAVNRAPSALTGALSAPAAMESMEGHLTDFKEGTTATAFGSLAAVASTLKQFRFSSSRPTSGRAYGGSSDVPTAHGETDKGEVTFDALLAINATTDTNVLDIFEAAGSVAQERRWRLSIDGAGNHVAHIDFRCRFRAVNRGDHEGERLYAVSGVWVKDATLAGRGQITLINDVSTVP